MGTGAAQPSQNATPLNSSPDKWCHGSYCLVSNFFLNYFLLVLALVVFCSENLHNQWERNIWCFHSADFLVKEYFSDANQMQNCVLGLSYSIKSTGKLGMHSQWLCCFEIWAGMHLKNLLKSSQEEETNARRKQRMTQRDYCQYCSSSQLDFCLDKSQEHKKAALKDFLSGHVATWFCQEWH